MQPDYRIIRISRIYKRDDNTLIRRGYAFFPKTVHRVADGYIIINGSAVHVRTETIFFSK